MDDLDSKMLEDLGLEYRGVIATGGTSVVYSVYCHQYKMNFALKKINSTKFVESEIENMIEINSPHVVPLYKYFKHKNYVYLLMEFCPNSLDKILLNEIYVSGEKLNKMAAGIILALRDCHQYGIAHGDIKPSNILIDNNGRVKICDFGLSKKITNEEQKVDLVGTLAYRSPEMIKLQPCDKFASDIWSLGVTLFIMSTGNYLWDISSRDAMLKSITTAKYDESKINNITIRNIISKCLQIEPNKRPSANELYSMLNYNPHSNKKKLMRAACSTVYVSPFVRSQNPHRFRHINSI